MKRKAIAAATALMTAVSAVSLPAFAAGIEELTETDIMNIIINGDNANTIESMLYRGTGMVSGNNSSRLLLDYKNENPEAYWEIMNYIFGKKGLEVAHLKLEMGSDVNSSSGTEPSVMRFEDEEADVTRGAGYQLAADAKTINPDLTLDMLWWSEPLWVTNAEDVYAARYKWYKQTLDAAYETYGLKFDYVSATQNERARDNDWIIYLSQHLKAETDCPYDYSAIKIVAGEEVCTWQAAGEILKQLEKGEEELANAVDVLGSHYTSSSPDSAKKLPREYGKELWFSEGSSSMSYAEGAWRFDEGNSGLTGINGALDIANRYLAMYPQGGMTLCQFQPIVAGYYDGVCYCQKQFINAADPWSGYYTLDSGFYVMLQFTQFMDKGWSFVDEACYCDGKPGGDGHAMVDAVYSYLTTCSPDKSDYSTVITNTTSEPITYDITVSNLEKAGDTVYLWETRGPDGGEYNENYFKPIGTITPDESDGTYKYTVVVKPYSIITLSTIDLPTEGYSNADVSERTILELPYSDDFEYADYPDTYLSSRGNAPRYTTDEGGAFEVENGVLTQQITADMKPKDWGYTPDPVTNFGDDRWFNYSVSADVIFAPAEDKGANYAGVGLRYNQGHNGASGYWLKLTESGSWSLWKNSKVIEEGTCSADTSKTVNLKIQAVDDNVKCWVNGEQVCDYTSGEISTLSAGRAALYSSYNRNGFDNFVAEAVNGVEPYITRYDNTNKIFSYSDGWQHETMSSFKNHKRSISTAEAGCSMTVEFDGTGIVLTGGGKGATATYSIDGGEAQEYTVPVTATRGVTFHLSGLEKGHHTLTFTITDGTFNVDAAEISGGEVFTAKQPAHSKDEVYTAIRNTEVQPGVTTETSSGEAADVSESSGNDGNVDNSADNSGNGSSSGSPDNGGFPVGAIVGIGAGVAAAAGIGVAIAATAKKKKK